MDEILRLERVIELPVPIVWDALVDPILAEGWLHPTARLVEGVEVRERREREALFVQSPEFGDVRFTLEEVEGGGRGTSTRLVLETAAHVDDRFRAPLVAGWQTRLDQLQELLRGHPVDWANWERDHGADYELHLQRAAAG